MTKYIRLRRVEDAPTRDDSGHRYELLIDDDELDRLVDVARGKSNRIATRGPLRLRVYDPSNRKEQ